MPEWEDIGATSNEWEDVAPAKDDEKLRKQKRSTLDVLTGHYPEGAPSYIPKWVTGASDAARTTGKNAAGLAAASVDFVNSAGKYPVGIASTVLAKIANPSYNWDELRNASGTELERLIPSAGRVMEVDKTPMYEAPMLPFHAMGEGINYLGDKWAEVSGGNKNDAGAAKVALDILTLGLAPKATTLAKQGLIKVDKALQGKPTPKIREWEDVKPVENVTQESPVKSMEEAVQQELPFSDSVETAALQRAKESTQRDMFTELDQAQRQFDPYAETQAKLALEEIDSPSPNYARDIDAAWQARDAELKKAAAEEKVFTEADKLQALEDSLRAKAYKAPDNLQVRADRGRPIKSNSVRGRPRGVIDYNLLTLGIPKLVDVIRTSDGFQAIKDGKVVGWLKSNLTPEQSMGLSETANVDIVKVDPSVKGTGVGKALYEAWNEAHEGRIAPSGKTSPDAWNVWKRNYPEKVDAFVAQEAARIRDGAPANQVLGNITDPAVAQRVLSESSESFYAPRYVPEGYKPGRLKSPGNRQLGGILINRTPKPIKSLKELIENNRIAKDPLPETIVADALKEGADTTSRDFTKYTASGATLEAATRNSALVLGTSRVVQNAIKRADYFIKETIFPVEQRFRQLKAPEVEGLRDVFKEEMFAKKRFTVEELQAKGLTEKQMEAYASLKDLQHKSFQIQNEARLSKGLEPIKEKEHYTASTWRGDYRQPVYNADGTLAWYLAADSRRGVKKQAEALLKQFPDLKVDYKKGHTVKGDAKRTDLQSAYSTMLDILGRDDPSIAKIKEVIENQMSTESYGALGQAKRFESKANIRGFVGDRPGKSSKSEAYNMFHEQIQQAKNAYKWSFLQEASGKLEKVLTNEKLVEQQPKNVSYAENYLKNALGNGEAQWVKSFEQAFRDAGLSPSVVNNVVGNMKSVFITQKLAGSIGYTAANMLQTFNTIPHLVSTFIGEGGNLLTALPLGMMSGVAMASGHYLNKIGGDFGKILGSTEHLKFLDDAFRYAEDNGVTSRSVYDESPINQRGVVGAATNVAGKTMTIPETYVRSAAYMTYVQMLKDSKKFKSNADIFQRAEELTSISMVDYRASERPMIFSKAGVIGNAANTLQTYSVNLFNQYRLLYTEAKRTGNPMPLITMLTLQTAMAGVMGLPGFNDIDKLIGMLKPTLPDAQWEKVKDFDAKLWVLENLGEAALYGPLSSQTGVAMSSRLSAPGIGDMAVSPLAPAADLAKQAGSVISAVADPLNKTKRAQAVRNVAPTGLQGLVETKLYPEHFSRERDDGNILALKSTDVVNPEGQYVRTPAEQKLRATGLRSQRETTSNEVAYKTGLMQKQSAERSRGIVDRFYAAARSGNTERAEELLALYTRINGEAITNAQIEKNLVEEFTSKIERAATTAERLEAVKALARFNKILRKRDGFKE